MSPTITNPTATIGAMRSGLHRLCPACGELSAIEPDQLAEAWRLYTAPDTGRELHAQLVCTSSSCADTDTPLAVVRVQLLEPIASAFTILAHAGPGDYPDPDPEDTRVTLTDAGRQLLERQAREQRGTDRLLRRVLS